MTYTLELELAYNTWSDATADWRVSEPLTIARGIVPGEQTAGVGQMAFALHNPDGRYSPGHASLVDGFEVGAGVRLIASDGVTAHTLFTGRIEAVSPQGDASFVTVVDLTADLLRARVGAFPLVTDAPPGVLVERLVSRSTVPVGRLAYWRIGHPQAAALGQGTALSGADTGVEFDDGQSVFPWAGDSWGAGMPVLGAIREICASENGTFYVRADGTPVFEGRHVRPAKTAADASLSAGMLAVAADRAMVRVANRVSVTTHPRAVSAAAGTLWQAGHSLLLRRGEVRTVVCRYADPDERAVSVGAVDIVTPVPGTDFTATAFADGTGSDLSASVSISVEAGASAAVLTISAAAQASTPVVYVHGLQLRGTALRRYHPASTSVDDDMSYLAFGRSALAVDMPLQADTRVGEGLARALLVNRKDPHPWLAVSLDVRAGAAVMAQAFARDIGDRVSITCNDLALDGAACFIEHIRHEITRCGASHTVTWQTTPADLYSCWALGSSPQAQLGSGASLAF